MHKKNKGKPVILYHRSYRKLPGSVKAFLFQFVLFALPFAALIVFFYPEITKTVCLIAEHVLTPFFNSNTLKIIDKPFFESIGTLSFLSLPGNSPTLLFSLLNAIACLLLLIVLPRIHTAKPVTIFAVIVGFVHLTSSLFFIFYPTYFPYSVADYSQLYMVQQVSIWFFAPLLMGVAVTPLPSPLTAKLITIVSMFLYSLAFGTVRYAVFLFILGKLSLIYMAVLFFALGPLIDFVYIVGLYSVHVTELATKIKGDFSLWRWRYRS